MIFRRRLLLLVTGCFISVIFLLNGKLNSNAYVATKGRETAILSKEIKTIPKDGEVKGKDTPINKNDTNLNLPKEQRHEEQAENTAANDATTAIRFQKRLDVMKSRCPWGKTSPLRKNWVANKNFLINYPRRILVCAVPKAGSTSWHMMIWAMRRKQSRLDPDTKFYNYNDTVENHHTSERLTTQQGLELITYNDGDDDMFKNPPTEKARRLILTRHPFARIISGWHQKFLPNSPYADLLFSRYPMLKKYVREKDKDHIMAWKDFAEFVADTGTNSKSLDYHFTPASEICKPCQYAYTYVLKAESVDRDEHWLKRRLNITDIDVGRKGVPPGGSLVNENPSANIRKYMSQLNDIVRRKLYLVYKEDFDMFGYTFDFKTLRSGGFE